MEKVLILILRRWRTIRPAHSSHSGTQCAPEVPMRSFGSPWWTGCLLTVFALAVRSPYPETSDALVDLHNIPPRQLTSAAFLLPSPQEVAIVAVGAESDEQRGTMTKLKTAFDAEKRELPWTGNAWILDLKTRAVVWELSRA